MNTWSFLVLVTVHFSQLSKRDVEGAVPYILIECVVVSSVGVGALDDPYYKQLIIVK